MNTLKPILRYPGAKWLIAEWILKYLPPHEQYVEPYCGSAAIFLNKAPAEHEVLNDLNGEIVNLFRILRTSPQELLALVELTPWAREEYDASYETAENALEQARRFLVRCWQAHGTRLNGKSGWRHRGPSMGGKTASLWKQVPERITAILDRLKDAEIECKPALEIIAEYPDALLYIDPPYMMDTRNGALYSHEMAVDDHILLLEALDKHPGPVVLSGYAHPLYHERLAHWYSVTFPTLAEHGKQQIEVLWLNQKAAQTQQLSLFTESEVVA